jgi:hypothetical protein
VVYYKVSQRPLESLRKGVIGLSRDSLHSRREFTRDVWNPKPEFWQPCHDVEANIRGMRFRSVHKLYVQLWEQLEETICMVSGFGVAQFTSNKGINNELWEELFA